MRVTMTDRDQAIQVSAYIPTFSQLQSLLAECNGSWLVTFNHRPIKGFETVSLVRESLDAEVWLSILSGDRT